MHTYTCKDCGCQMSAGEIWNCNGNPFEGTQTDCQCRRCSELQDAEARGEWDGEDILEHDTSMNA